jgi:hypothetical protein
MARERADTNRMARAITMRGRNTLLDVLQTPPYAQPRAPSTMNRVRFSFELLVRVIMRNPFVLATAVMQYTVIQCTEAAHVLLRGGVA